jgi:FkbM family methyltransferase
MIYKIAYLYSLIFAHPWLYKWHKLLLHLALRGLGILNSADARNNGEETFLKKYLSSKPNATIFDVGANVGNYSREILKVVPKAKVFAFEPHPKNFEKLKTIKNQTDTNNFEAFHCACGNQNGNLELHDYADRGGSSHASLYKGVIEEIHKKKSVSVLVDLIKLDDFVKEHEIKHIDLLKIDTEGHELAVLKGLLNFIDAGNVSAVHFEFNSMNVLSRSFFRDFYQILSGYTFYRLLPNGWVDISKYDPIYCEIFAFQNIIAIQK